ncbi:hypothetical protein [Paraclostridium bifermentans]|uniref:hypothetical protein n=1 Tax=Paraclostridium bifermentans TaxID=1490 RepID=UPI00374F8D68
MKEFKIGYKSSECIDKCIEDTQKAKENMENLRNEIRNDMKNTETNLSVLNGINYNIIRLNKILSKLEQLKGVSEEHKDSLNTKQNVDLSKPINLIDLDVGEMFHVVNGNWDGEIVINHGNKAVKHMHGTFDLDGNNYTDLDVELK